MTAVRKLADQQLTVMCTIHQPSAAIFALFHSLLLLSAGKVIFFGPAKEASAFFSERVHQFPCTAGSNPADFLLMVAGGKFQDGSDQAADAEELAQAYLASAERADLLSLLTSKEASAGWESAAVQSTPTVVSYHTSTWSQVYFLCRRVIIRNFKDPSTVLSYLARHLVVAVFYGSLYYKSPGGTATSSYTNRLAMIVYALMFVTFSNIQQVALVFENRLIYYRERAAGAYGVIPHFIASFVVSVPTCFLNVLVFSAIMYDMAGLYPSARRFWFFFAVLFACSFTGLFLCHLVANCTSNVNSTLTVLPVFIFPSILVSGFVVVLPDLPIWLRSWAPLVSFMRWGFQALVINEFADNSDLPYGEYFIEDLGFTSPNKETCFHYLLIFCVVFFVAAFLSLKYVNFDRR